MDIVCSSHLCKSLQDPQKIKSLNKGDFELFGTSPEFIQAEAIGTRILKLPSGKVLELKIYFYISNFVRNIISIPLLLEQDFEINLKNNGCSIYFSNEYYGSAYVDNDLLLSLLSDNVLHIDNMKKRKREDVNVTYLWHCRLGHINESRTNKLYKDKFFDPYNYESYETYESCLMGKMIKTPFIGYREKTSDILNLVHTDVYGPMSTQVRGGYSYFITFTDDRSRFGYVYLMKYKSEVFDKFKEYQRMVKK